MFKQILRASFCVWKGGSKPDYRQVQTCVCVLAVGVHGRMEACATVAKLCACVCESVCV